ncbi:hypothetical protein ACAW63_22655 [Pseudomonas sp. QE6]|uniref:hypothetical protein n=1 Tax=Pseudomonas sp. QE6 TaxID=3242491 RepID=UPI00352798F4
MSNTICNTPSRTASFGPKDELHFSISYLAELMDKPIEHVIDTAFDLLPQHGYDSLFNHLVKDENDFVTDLYLSFKDCCILLLDFLSTDDALITLRTISDDYARHRIPQLQQFIANHR